MGADGFGNLDAVGADTAAASVDEDAGAFVDVRDEGVVGGDCGDWCAGSMAEAKVST